MKQIHLIIIKKIHPRSLQKIEGTIVAHGTCHQYMHLEKKNIIMFKQLFFYYKFNLLYDKKFWVGTKACKKKKLKSLSWLRNIKLKKYPFWRLDTLFSETKQINLDIIEDGGIPIKSLMVPE